MGCIMLEDEEKDDEIEFDFSKIKNFFKRKKKGLIEETKEEAKELKEEIKERIDAEKEEIKEEREEIKKEERRIDELKKEEKEVEKIERKIQKDPKTSKEKIEEIKEDLEKEDDEEINIDFSKIKNWFKNAAKDKEYGKKIIKKETGESRDSEDDDEISFDFKKVKNFFRGFAETKKEEKREDDDEVSFDFKALSNFFVRYKSLFLILIPFIISIYLRMMPAYLPATDDWAQSSVYSGVKDQIKKQIDQQYPNLPDANKAPLIETEFKNLLEQQRPAIEQQVKATSEYFKSRLKNEDGQTYLLAIDPYFWMRHAANIIDHGYPGDEIKNGVQWDNHMMAPTGRPADVSFHSYFEAYLFKFVRVFNRDVGLMNVVFYVPILLSALAVIPAFFIARRLGGNFGGFVAAFIVAIHPAFLGRTAGGFADTDAYNVMFPLYIAWFFLEAFEAKDTKKRIMFASLSGALIGLYSFTWIGWWYIFDFILASAAIYIIYYALMNLKELRGNFFKSIKENDIKNMGVLLLVFIVSSAIFISLFSSFYSFQTALLQPLGFMQIKQVATSTVWPNVYTTVAEQNEASLGSIIDSNGGKFLFFLGLIGILFTLTRKRIKRKLFLAFSSIWYLIALFLTDDLHVFLVLISIPLVIRLGIAIKANEKDIDVRYAVLLIIWFIATIYASTKGVRFTLLLVPAFGIAFGICLGMIYKHLSEFIEKGIHINKNISKIIVIFVLCLLLVAPYKSAKATAKNEIPSMNDAWWNSLEKIKLESEPDAIINSWWDFGHWFKMIADRKVTFDGTSQGTPQAHWIGNTLLTDNEDIAVGILRMLDCSGYSDGTYAFDEIDKTINDVPRSVDIIYEIIVLDKEKARSVLEKYKIKNIDKILEYTHCGPPENYFITSDDMIGKSGVWGHFGSWNFNKALMYFTLNKKEYKGNKEKSISFLEQRFNLTETEAENVYFEIRALSTNREVNDWVSPWPGYASGLTGCTKKNNEVECGNGIKVDLSSYEADFPTQQGIKHPNSLVYATEDEIKIKEYKNETIGVSAVLIPSGDGFESILTSPEMAGSMFTRLFFIEGHGLKHFKKFSDERSIFGGRIIIWKVDWEGTEPNIMDEFKKKTNETINESLIKEYDEENKTEEENLIGDESKLEAPLKEDEVKEDINETYTEKEPDENNSIEVEINNTNIQ